MKSACVSTFLSGSTAAAETAGDRCRENESLSLDFKPVTFQSLPEIRRVLQMSPSLTCDYSIGGIYMWINYFKYRYCICRDTLFIVGVEENSLEKQAFSCPVGAMPLPEAIEMLERYCDDNGLDMRFSAVPADRLSCFMAYNPDFKVEELTDWADYVYEIADFASLSGKKMAKKRNHVNRFMNDYPCAHLEELGRDDVETVKHALLQWTAGEDESGSPTRREELSQVINVLDNLEIYGFDGAVLRSGDRDDRIVAFTLGEVINDTLFVHVEKMDHLISGAGEAVAHLFAGRMLQKYPELRFLNREEDCGDPGLRRAKQSWQPAMLLRKYNVVS